MEGKLRSYYDYTPIDLCLKKLECSEKEVYISDANKDQWEQIEKINKALASYQDILIRDAKMLENRLKARFEGGFIEDYAMEFCLVFRLREDDPDYDENDDNFLAIINEPIISGEMSKQKSRWTQNRNEYLVALSILTRRHIFAIYLQLLIITHISIRSKIYCA